VAFVWANQKRRGLDSCKVLFVLAGAKTNAMPQKKRDFVAQVPMLQAYQLLKRQKGLNGCANCPTKVTHSPIK
jgi:hypothetical protein